MSCEICGRSSCMPSFHSMRAQGEHERAKGTDRPANALRIRNATTGEWMEFSGAEGTKLRETVEDMRKALRVLGLWPPVLGKSLEQQALDRTSRCKRCRRLESVLGMFFRVTEQTRVTGNFWMNLKRARFWERARAVLDDTGLVDLTNDTKYHSCGRCLREPGH